MDGNTYLERFKELTERQKEVLSYVCQGMTYQEVGEQLFISKATVTSHMVHIYEKLGLDHLHKNQRAAALFEHYCPLLKKHPPVVIVGEEVDEDEELEPVSPEVQQMVEEDENALVVWKAAPAVEIILPPQDPPRRRNFGCLWMFVGIILGVGILGGILYFTGHLPVSFGNVQTTETLEEMTYPTNTPEATQTAYVVVVTATSPPVTETSTPTETLPPTETPTPSITPSPTTEPDTAPDSVLEFGDWWKEDGVWIRIGEYRLKDDGYLAIRFEYWNKTDDILSFQWNPSVNFSLSDNTGHSYRYNSYFYNDENNELVDPGEVLIVENGSNYWTVAFEDDFMFNSSVNELILTVRDLSRIDEAQFKLQVKK